MTNPARNDILLAHGGNIVRLVPSLRAATILERLHGGFPALLTKIEEQDTATIRAVILSSVTDTAAAQRLLASLTDAPLAAIHAATLVPCVELIAALMLPEATTDTTPATSTTDTPRMAWADLYAELFKIGTGWIGWTPEATWNATPAEIIEAFDGHVAKLKAIHGSGDEDDTNTPGLSAEQRQANITAGLDPQFDRAGLQALKARHG